MLESQKERSRSTGSEHCGRSSHVSKKEQENFSIGIVYHRLVAVNNAATVSPANNSSLNISNFKFIFLSLTSHPKLKLLTLAPLRDLYMSFISLLFNNRRPLFIHTKPIDQKVTFIFAISIPPFFPVFSPLVKRSLPKICLLFTDIGYSQVRDLLLLKLLITNPRRDAVKSGHLTTC